jgi:carbon monoxide dehydrogenase subunit G
MAIELSDSLQIQAPPDRVYQAFTDHNDWKNWMKGFVRVEPLTPGPFGKGTRFREVRKMMGHEAAEVFEVTACDPGRSVSLYIDGTKGSSKKGEYRFDYTFEPRDGGTLLAFRGKIQVPGKLWEFLGKLMCGMMRKMFMKDMLALKAHVEKNSGK